MSRYYCKICHKEIDPYEVYEHAKAKHYNRAILYFIRQFIPEISISVHNPRDWKFKPIRKKIIDERLDIIQLTAFSPDADDQNVDYDERDEDIINDD